MQAAPTPAMVNIQAAGQRRKALAQRLAAQMAARAAVGARAGTGRIQSNGRAFGNATDLRAAATPPVSIGGDLPNGRVRPAGFDASGPPTFAPGTVAMPAPPIDGGGGLGVTPPTPPTPDTTYPSAAAGNAALGGTPYGGYTSNPDGSFTPNHTDVGAPWDPGSFNSNTPLTTAAPPDPYTVMVARLQAQLSPYGTVTGPRYGGLQL